jgi:RNA polymerase sigma-70 factor (ECF subfamily)
MGARHVARGGDVDVAWLKTVARNKLIDHWRARARQERKLALAYSVEPQPMVDETAPADAERVTRVLADLNPTYRAALVLRHLDGLSVPEVAELIGRSVEATEQVLSRARAAFRSAYSRASGVTHA